MKTLIATICLFVTMQQCFKCFASDDDNTFDNLLETSDHGHETGIANKEKRCPESLQLPLYDHILGSARNPNLLPSILTRRDATEQCKQCKKAFCLNDKKCTFCSRLCNHPQIKERSADDKMRLESRFNPEIETGLSEMQERYYTVGSFGAGPKQKVIAKLLNIPENVQLERLIILAKNKSKNKSNSIPHPVVIDTAHVFTTNDGKPAELDLELHNVKGNDNEDINNLTSQLNKELDTAIDTKKHMLGDSHLTPQEIDKIIEHVVDQMNKKGPIPGNKETEIVGSKLEEPNKTRESELDDDLDGFKKKKKKKGSKKHGFIPEDQDIVGATELPQTSTKHALLGDTIAQDSVTEINEPGKLQSIEDDLLEMEHMTPEFEEDDSLLGTKKGGFKGFGKLKGKGKGKGKGGYYRENEDNEEDENPLHADMKDETVAIESPTEESLLGHKKSKGKGHGKGGHFLESEEDREPAVLGVEHDDMDDAMLGTKKKFKGGFGKKKGKGKKGYYRENEDGEQMPSDSNLGSSQPNYQPTFQSPNQYNPNGNQQKYGNNQPIYEEPNDEYPDDLPIFEPVEPETYHGNADRYPAPQSANQYQPNYQPPQYQKPQVPYQPQRPQQNQYQPPQMTYQKPQQQYHPQPPQQYQPPQSAQAAYSGAKSYKSVEPEPEPIDEDETLNDSLPEFVPADGSVLGQAKEAPEDPTLKANFFENEYHRLRQWISDNVPEHKTPPLTSNSNENEEIVDKFTKVIEKDLTDGKKLTPLETKNLDKKIAKLVRDNINASDPLAAESKSKKKLDKLEELVEEEAEEADQKDMTLRSSLDDLKSRFSPADEALTPKRKVENLKNKLRSSLDNLKRDQALADNKWKLADIEKPKLLSLPTGEKKPLLDLKHIVDDIKTMPHSLIDGAGKLADIITPRPEKVIPRLGQRAGGEPVVGQAKSGKKFEAINNPEDETVGCLEDLKDKFNKKDKDSGEWHMIPNYDNYDHHDHHGYDNQYRATDKKDDIVSNLNKLLHPAHHGQKKNPLTANERSEEDEETPTLPDIIRDLEENLHLPTLPPLPSLRQNHHQHHTKPPALPKIQVNGEHFIPDQANFRPPLPEIPQESPNRSFQHRNFPEQFAPPQFQGPMQPFHSRSGMPPPPQQQQQQQQHFVGAVQQQQQQQQQRLPHDLSHFGKIVPEALHDLHQRDVSEQMKKHRMYFVGDGIKLPLHMHKHEDGTLHLSVDLEKLCKCNVTNCNGTKLAEPDFISTNLMGSQAIKDTSVDIEDADDGMDIGDVPLQMTPPSFDEDDDDENDEKEIAKRSPRFNYYDIQPQSASVVHVPSTDEQFDHISAIKKAYKENLQRKIDSFNNDIKEYYANEAKIKNDRLEDEDMEEFLQKRVGLLTNILSWMKDIAVEEEQ